MFKKEITAATLKWVAVITMIIDHFGASILEGAVTRGTLMPTPQYLLLDLVVRAIGRIAFPIFIFLMLEGLYHTRNRWKYLGRLGLLALISEIPFDWAFWLTRNQVENHQFMEFQHQNVFVTLSIGLFMMILLEAVRPHSMGLALDREIAARDGIEFAKERWYVVLGRIVLCIIIALACMWLNNFLRADYGFVGIVGFLGMYLGNLLWRVNWRTLLLGVAGLTIFNAFEIVSVLDLLLIRNYRGTKGSSMNKWVFYFIYPVHLAIYGLIVMFVVLK